ncbi:MAG TPA: secondary thiamine-phosphate synthase enzyme YjbQ [Candidatus Saccharimonadales bacterium]|nr:secondary thiamine-phosphate synthase enzyme YjbQ [Candidatus Saccharimonadales bacterium]
MDVEVATRESREVVDITERVQATLQPDAKAAVVFCAHTTCAVTTADLDPGTDQDLLDAVEQMIPKLDYRHPHDPGHVWTHIASSLIGPSVTVPVKDGKLVLGSWQRIVLVELDGPRKRNLIVTSL